MVDPKIMCQKHLCGEHVELHMFISIMKKKQKVDGYLRNNCLEPKMLYQRHEDIKNEMLRRGYNHRSEINKEECIQCINYLSEEQQNYKVDALKSLSDLLTRCTKCHQLFGDIIKCG